MAFLYKGISSENYFIVEKVTRSLLPPISHLMTAVPNRPGLRHQNSELGIRKVSFRIRMRHQNIEDLNEMIRVVAEWLFSEKQEELVLSKEPDKYYMALLEGDTDLEELVTVGKGTLSFICPDPIAYDRIVSVQTIASGTEAANVSVTGSYKTFPIIRATFTDDVTHFAYGTEGTYDQVLVGEPVDVEQTKKPLKELKLSNTGDNLTGWSSAGTFVEGGLVSGAMIANTSAPGYLTFSSIGTNTAGWHGPAVKANLPETLDDWIIEWYVKFSLPNTDQVSRIELYLLDVNANVLGKIAMTDNFSLRKDTFATFRIGRLAENDRHLMYHGHGDKAGAWNAFKGVLRLEKRYKSYHAYIAEIDSKGNHHTRKDVYFYDAANKFSEADLAQVMLHIGGYKQLPMTSANNVYSDKLLVYKRNSFYENEIPILASAGDVLEIDHNTKSVTLNGEPFKAELNPISQLFAFNPGNNTFAFTPNANVEVIYKSRWL